MTNKPIRHVIKSVFVAQRLKGNPPLLSSLDSEEDSELNLSELSRPEDYESMTQQTVKGLLQF